MSLAWSGVSGHRADVYRNGSRLVTTHNDGSFTDKLPRRASGTFTYRVCAAGTNTCSCNVSVGLGGSAKYFAPRARSRLMRAYERQERRALRGLVKRR